MNGCNFLLEIKALRKKRGIRVIFLRENEGFFPQSYLLVVFAMLREMGFFDNILSPFHSYFSIRPIFLSDYRSCLKLLSELHLSDNFKSK